MKKDRAFDDKRLLGTLDGVETRFLSEALEYYDDPIPGKTKKARAALYKRIALLAACIVLCAMAFPLVNYVLPRLGVVFGGNAGAGESSGELSEQTYTDGNFIFFASVGEVPEEFKVIVEQNLFLDSHVVGDKLYRSYRKEGKNIFEIISYSGEQMGEVVFPIADYGPLTSSHTTHDGNILAVFNCPEHSSCQHTRLVIFNAEGRILSDRLLEDVTSGCFEYGFCAENGFIFVGSYTKQAVAADMGDDISIIVMGQDLSIVKKYTLGEDNHHNILRFAEYGQDKLSVYFSSSNEIDRDNCDVTFYQYDFDTDLNPIGNSVTDKESIPSKAYAFGKYYDSASLNRMGYCELMEYDDFDLVVANFGTANYDISAVNSIYDLCLLLQYRETVYAAYSKDGELIWRIGVDSTDYEECDRILKEKQEYEAWRDEMPEENSN